jgi:predicted acetyltransferase
MPLSQQNAPLPVPPDGLAHGDIALRLDGVLPGDPERGFVPYYHFLMLNRDGKDVGHINFRVGDTDHVRLYVGHIGFGVLPEHRGHHYAAQACRAIAPWVRHFYETVVVTCDPDNEASRRTLEGLGARFVEEIPVPPHESQHLKGSMAKRRYYWSP